VDMRSGGKGRVGVARAAARRWGGSAQEVGAVEAGEGLVDAAE